MHANHAERVRELERKLERGWITLDEILMLASGSPVHLDEATELSRRAGLRVTGDSGLPHCSNSARR